MKIQGRNLSPAPAFDGVGKELEDIRKKILATRDIPRDLARVAKTAEHRETVLRLLALAVLDDKMKWRELVRRTQARFKTLAEDFRRLIEKAEALAADPLFRYLPLLLGASPIEEQLTVSSESQFRQMMTTLAQQADDKAKFFALALRTGVFHQRRIAPLALSNYVKQITGEYHDDVVARLLTDAYEAIGVEKQFSADQLKKSRGRHTTRA